MGKTAIAVLSGVTTFVGILVAGCSEGTPPFDLAAMKAIIREKNDRFTQAHITGDTTFLNNVFTHDARVLAPHADAVVGRHAIALLNSQWVSFGIREFREETMALYGNEEYLIDEGTYYLRYGKDNTIEMGKYLNVWKQVNGDWKIYSNMWNTSMPLAPADQTANLP